MQPGVSVLDGHHIGGVLANRIDDRVATTKVHSAHATQMPREVSFVEKVGEHELIQQGRAEIECLAYAHETCDELMRHHEVSQPECWKQHFAERAEVDDAVIGVHPLQRAECPARVSKLAVVVILENPRVVSLRPAKELESPRHTERDA